MPSNQIKVFLRVRPTDQPSGVFEFEPEEGLVEFNVPVEKASWLVNNSRTYHKFKFDNLFGMPTTQDDVFNHVAKEAVESALTGFNSTIFAYGQTGSGKTFTMTGGPQRYADRGIIPRALQYIFSTIRENSEEQYRVFVSYLEIYNENGYDLLDPKQDANSIDELPRVKLMEDSDGNVHLRNLSLHQAASEEDALNYLFLGDTNRAICETPMNPVSSRSHCIFTISIEARNVETAKVKRSKLHLVDLAGSERVHKTKAEGALLREASYINTSLHYLQMVIVALQERRKGKQSHVPYRNSMMTSVLRDSLGGNCKTAMIATISAELQHTDESISTCRFAQRVALVKNDAFVNEEVDPTVLVRQLKDQLAAREAELDFLKGQTGEERDLTADEAESLRKNVRNWLWGGSGQPADLKIGKWTTTRIYAAFMMMREEAHVQLKGAQGGRQLQLPSVEDGQATESKMSTIDDAGHAADIRAEKERLEEQVSKLQEQLQRRDHEIAILVNMVKQKGTPASTPPMQQSTNSNATSMPPTNQMSNVSQSTMSGVSSSLPGSKSSQLSHTSSDSIALPLLPDGSRSSVSLLQSRDAARDAYFSTHPSMKSLEEHKQSLKEKYTEAKATGARVNEARAQVGRLKSQIETVRIGKAMQGIASDDSSKENSKQDSSTEEEVLRKEIDHQKQIYKDSFEKLRSLKSEIEYTQKLLENGKLRLSQEFERWYGAAAQVLHDLQNGQTTDPSSITDSSMASMKSSTSHFTGSQAPPSDIELPHGVQLTGNEEADRDILEFYRTKQRLMQRRT